MLAGHALTIKGKPPALPGDRKSLTGSGKDDQFISIAGDNKLPLGGQTLRSGDCQRSRATTPSGIVS